VLEYFIFSHGEENHVEYIDYHSCEGELTVSVHWRRVRVKLKPMLRKCSYHSSLLIHQVLGKILRREKVLKLTVYCLTWGWKLLVSPLWINHLEKRTAFLCKGHNILQVVMILQQQYCDCELIL
jgi:hypothetical protein